MADHVRIYLDESVPVAVAEGLKRRGVDAWAAKETRNLGLTDKEQLGHAVREQAAVFTHDDIKRIPNVRTGGQG